MTKEKLLFAINAMLGGAETGYCHDELSTLLSLVNNVNDSEIAAAWSELKEE